MERKLKVEKYLRRNILDFEVYPRFVLPEATTYFLKILNTLPWRSLQKRSSLLYGDEGLVYVTRYSNRRGGWNVKKSIPEPWSDFLKTLKENIEQVTGEVFTCCVIQRYPSGKYGINKHRDKEMAPGSIIAGFSVGVTRTFEISRNSNVLVSKAMQDGDLYVIKPPTNNRCLHCVPKDQTEGVRYSLTFRNYK